MFFSTIAHLHGEYDNQYHITNSFKLEAMSDNNMTSVSVSPDPGNLVTLKETLTILIPEQEWIRDCCCDLLKTRWSYVRSKHISEHACEPPVKSVVTGDDNKMKTYSALPLDVALHHVEKWIPWALFVLKNDLEEVCGQSGDYTHARISEGALAGEEITC